MKKLLLLLPLALALVSAKAQVYTITDEGGNNVANGSTYNIELTDENTNNTQHWTLHSTVSDDIVFQVMSTTAVSGTQNFNCVGAHCYSPNDMAAHTENLDAGNTASLSLEYKPSGHTDPAVIEIKIHKVGDENESITFYLSYTVLTAGVGEVSKQNNLIAYPNPANQNVSISYNVKEASEIIFYNIVGEQVKKVEVNAGSNQLEIETSSLPAGTYFYSMISDSKITATKRLVIKH